MTTILEEAFAAIDAFYDASSAALSQQIKEQGRRWRYTPIDTQELRVLSERMNVYIDAAMKQSVACMVDNRPVSDVEAAVLKYLADRIVKSMQDDERAVVDHLFGHLHPTYVAEDIQ